MQCRRHFQINVFFHVKGLPDNLAAFKVNSRHIGWGFLKGGGNNSGFAGNTLILDLAIFFIFEKQGCVFDNGKTIMPQFFKYVKYY